MEGVFSEEVLSKGLLSEGVLSGGIRMALCRSRAKTVHLVKRVTHLLQEYTIYTGTQTINVAKTGVICYAFCVNTTVC